MPFDLRCKTETKVEKIRITGRFQWTKPLVSLSLCLLHLCAVEGQGPELQCLLKVKEDLC